MKRRNAVRLTLRTIEKAAAKPTSYFIWDLDQPGFGLRIEPTGAKSFYIHYCPPSAAVRQSEALHERRMTGSS